MSIIEFSFSAIEQDRSTFDPNAQEKKEKKTFQKIRYVFIAQMHRV